MRMSGGGRKRKPTALAKLDGTRKSRINENEPRFSMDNNPDPPEFLDEYAKAEWNRIYPELSKNEVLRTTDRGILIGYCEAYSDFRKAKDILDKSKMQIFKTPNGAVQQLPHVSMKRNAMMLMLKYGSELGITPSSRSGIKGGGRDDDEKSDLLRKLMGDGSNVSKK